MGFRHNSIGLVPDEIRRPKERRATERYVTNGATIPIEWSDGEASRTVRALLKNISMGGALAEASLAPQPGTIVRIPVPGDARAGKINARVVRVARLRRSISSFLRRSNATYHISLEFEGGCPYDLFKATTDRFVREIYVNHSADTNFDSGDWR